MPRYVVTAIGLIYADKILPDLASSVVEVCRLADSEIGETGRTYRVVPRYSDDVDYEVYIVDPSVPSDAVLDLDRDGTYVASVAGSETAGVSGAPSPTMGRPAGTDLRTFALASAQRPGPSDSERVAAEAARPAIVTKASYSHLYDALDLLTIQDGGEGGVGGYVAARHWRTQLPAVDDTLSRLSPEDFNTLVSGSDAERAEIAGRSPALTTAAELLDEFIGR